MSSPRHPLINGDQVTFIWYGSDQPNLIGDFNDWGTWGTDGTPTPMQQTASDRWEVTLTFPTDAYIEYGFDVNGVRSADPLNPNSASDGFGNINSSFFMPDLIDSPLAQPQPDVPQGTLTTHQVDTHRYLIGGERLLRLYQPPVDYPTPLLICFDGTGYLQKAGLVNTVNNLIAQQRIQPISLALLDPSGHGRVVEYACSDATVAYLIKSVIPLAQQRLNLIDIKQYPASYAIMGASMGGLMSLYASLRAPEIFGKVLCESGAFAADHLYYRSVIYDLIRYMPSPPIKLWMDVALHEWYLRPNREMLSLLRERGYDVTYHEQSGGHNYPSWRNVVWRGLEHLFSQK
jgi:enterochelin esterase-like enzyme